jgi:hypothetical protein
MVAFVNLSVVTINLSWLETVVQQIKRSKSSKVYFVMPPQILVLATSISLLICHFFQTVLIIASRNVMLFEQQPISAFSNPLGSQFYLTATTLTFLQYYMQ